VRRNPYLYPPSGSGGGYLSPPGAYFGASSGVYTPAPGSVFGYGRSPQWGYNRFGGDCGPCAPGAPAPNPGAEHRLGQLLNMLRNPQGQWPNMPPLDGCSEQEAAALVVAAAQRHSDDLTVYYGVDSGAVLVPAGATANIIVTPQKRHIPEKLSLTEAMASAFLITGIFAGVEPVLATTGPISAAIFVQDSTAPAFKSVIMDVGMDFTVGVTNISGAPARFTTTVIGKPVPAGL
jgi:hypothetical protein